MFTIRKSNDRGRSQMDWLDSHHSFSFANYYDPRHMQFNEKFIHIESQVDDAELLLFDMLDLRD